LVVIPSDDSVFAGSPADIATECANGRLRSNSAWMSASSSGNTKPHPAQPSPSSGVHASVPRPAWA
jgi:hypothetical protein